MEKDEKRRKEKSKCLGKGIIKDEKINTKTFDLI
jgi:hypothetical protein